MNYTIITDTGCDIPVEMLNKWGIPFINLTFHTEKEGVSYTNEDITYKEFYDKMREGTVFKTAAPSIEDFKDLFEPILASGQDILYLGFSSGLSGTINTGKIVAKELKEKYPERKIYVLDTLCASGGEGFVVYCAVQKYLKSESIDDVYAYVSELAPKVSHWFTVDDLVYLKRNGRVSPTTALAGNLLGIKPILHVDDTGYLVKVSTARGRKQTLNALANKYIESATGDEDGMYFISHADCLDDAKYLEQLLYKHTKKKSTLIVDISPVIGAHSGPGTVALFYVGKNR